MINITQVDDAGTEARLRDEPGRAVSQVVEVVDFTRLAFLAFTTFLLILLEHLLFLRSRAVCILELLIVKDLINVP